MNKNSIKNIYIPKLRFKGFDDQYNKIKLCDVLFYEQPTKYIVKSDEYNDSFDTPVLTANKSFILGKTDEETGIYSKGPVIIFDDFTTDNKYVDFDFKVKSSAIKLLTTDSKNNLFYLYQLININPFTVNGHNRHWIRFSSQEIKWICSLQEQNKIAKFFSLLDQQILLLENKLQLIESFFEIFKINFFKKFETNEKLILFNEFILANKNRNKSNLNYDVVTVSNKYGFIKQEQYFSQKKLVASKNKQNYYILENKYFGFNPSRINVGSFGYWNLNEKVLISPIYESFKLNNNFYLDEVFFDYVKSKYFKKQLTKYESGSVRKGIKMDDLKMFTIFKISLISQKEYIDKRALILSQMNFLKKKINLLKLKKEYFLKKMFV